MTDNNKTVAQFVPSAVMEALDRMRTPLHESRLAGATAQEDARCMQVIYDHIMATALGSMPQAAQPVAIPDGWVLVPKEPTEEMAKAEMSLSMKSWKQRYQAMLAAAPVPPAPSADAIRNAALEEAIDICEVLNDQAEVGDAFDMAIVSIRALQSPPVSKEPLQTAPCADKGDAVTQKMIDAGMRWLSGFHHMRKADKESVVAEAFKAMRAAEGGAA